MTKKGFLRDFQGVIGGFLRDFVTIAGFIIFFDYEIAEKSLGYLCTERDFWGVYRGMLGDSRTQKPRAAVAVYAWKNCNLGEYSVIYHYKLFSDQKKSNMTLERIKLLEAIAQGKKTVPCDSI